MRCSTLLLLFLARRNLTLFEVMKYSDWSSLVIFKALKLSKVWSGPLFPFFLPLRCEAVFFYLSPFSFFSYLFFFFPFCGVFIQQQQKILWFPSCQHRFLFFCREEEINPSYILLLSLRSAETNIHH